jgi:hypothetical protein
MAVKTTPGAATRFLSVHVDPFHVSALPWLSTATQNVGLAHDTAPNEPACMSWIALCVKTHVPPLPVGLSVPVIKLPLPSAMAQNRVPEPSATHEDPTSPLYTAASNRCPAGMAMDAISGMPGVQDGLDENGSVE